MVQNIILTCLIIIAGIFVFCLILLFGLKFCKDNEEVSTSSKQQNLLKELLESIPIWVKIVAILTTQFAVVYIANIWFPTWMENHDWILNLSSSIGTLSIIIFAIIVFSTNDNEHIQ